MGSVAAAGGDAAEAGAGGPPAGLVEVVAAPSNLGLRPPAPGREPGVWRAPGVLLSQGLGRRLNAARIVELPRPRYDFGAQPGTRIRNGTAIREHALRLADAVAAALAVSRFAVVAGGDCSILLGCLAGARRGGRCGLVHVNGHRDFFHPGNYDASSRLGSAAWHGPRAGHWPRRAPAHPLASGGQSAGDRRRRDPDRRPGTGRRPGPARRTRRWPS